MLNSLIRIQKYLKGFVTLLWLESRVISGHKEIGVRTKNEKYILKLNCARHNYVIVDLLDFWEG